MKQRLLARIEFFAKSEILNLIPASEYERIKANDPEPEFRAYVVAHEGEGSGTIVKDYESKPFKQRWYREAIRNIVDKIKEGIKFFHLHKAGSNSHDLRQPVGEVVGKGLKEINGKLSAIVVAYIYPEFRDFKFDVASIEADIVYRKRNNSYEIDEIQDVTGIALGDGQMVSPGFPGATLLGAIQAFAAAENRGKNKTGGSDMTLEELKELVQSEKIKPSDLFDEEILVKDPLIVAHVKREKQGEYEHRRRTDEAFTKAKSEWEEEKKALQAKLNELSLTAAKQSVGEMLKEISEARKLDDKRKAFVEKNLKAFEIKDPNPDVVKKDLDAFVASKIQEFDEIAKLFESGSDKKNLDKEQDKKKDESEKTNDEVSEYEDPSKNDFIAI